MHKNAPLRFAPLALAAAALLVPAARAEPNPYYLGVSAGYTHESNLFRSTQATSDSFWSAGLLAGLDQPIGRQRLYANANVRSNTFQDQEQLDNVSYGLNAGIDWETINKLSGTLSVFSNRSLANFSPGLVQANSAKNLETTNQLLAKVQYGGAGLLSVDGGAIWRRLDYTDPSYVGANFEQTTVFAGLKARPSGGLTLGVALRATRGEYPDIAVDYDRNDVDLTAVWVPTGLSTLNARLSYGKQKNKSANGATPLSVEQRDFSGATGFLGWDYKPTGKLSLRTTVSRDTGTETSFLRLSEEAPNLIAFGDVSRLTTALSFVARYEATAKIVANAGVLVQRRTLSDLFLPTPGVSDERGRDRFGRVWFGLTWAPTLHWQLGCNVAHEKRTETGGLAVPYSANSAGCSLQYVIR
jgi:hypothetical protein